MEDKEVIKKIKEWLKSNVASDDMPSAVRINSQALLEYINNWQKG